MSNDIMQTDKKAIGISYERLFDAFMCAGEHAVSINDVASRNFWKNVILEFSSFSDDMVMIAEFDSKDLE